MKIEDSFTLNAPQGDVWIAITNPYVVTPCVPGCQNVQILGPNIYSAEVNVKVGPIKAQFRLNVKVTRQIPPLEIHSTTRGEEGSKASVLQAESIVRLKQIDVNTTEVYYCSDVNIIGRLGKFGFGVMKKKAKTLGDEFAEAFKKTLEFSPEPVQ